jgi:hypothetical protein
MTNRSCAVVSTDYLDKDVYLNIELFYTLAGYRVYVWSQASASASRTPDLIVMLRGDPGKAWADYRGPVHVYDYVKELDVDWSDRFPHASRLERISLEGGDVSGYLPVFPEIWRRSFSRKNSLPVHLSNYKPMPADTFQRDLVSLIQQGRVRVFGGRWQLIGLPSRSLSYWQANRLIAASSCCFGLMYPYQRGRSLSGRMWQAPINGCFVISEAGTNPYALPGLIEVESFGFQEADRQFSLEECRRLSVQASVFWQNHTTNLARQLDLSLPPQLPVALIQAQRRTLVRWHLEFLWDQTLSSLQGALQKQRLRVTGTARRLNLHPRQIAAAWRRPHQ